MPSGVRLQVLTGPLTFRPAPLELVAAVQEAQVTENAGQRSGFQLRLALGRGSLVERMLADGSLDPPTRMLLVLHVDGRPQVLSDGVVTRHDVARSNDAGASTLTLTGVDVSQMMDLIDLSDLPMPMPAEARVLTLLAPFAAYGVVPMVVPSVLVFAPNPVQRIPAVRGTSFAYVSQLADEVGYTFYVEPGPTPGMNTAYWGPEVRAGQPQPALTVNADAGANVESLSFSFDGVQKTVYLLTAFPEQVRVPIPLPVPDVSPLNPPLGRKIPIPLSYRRMNVGRSDPSGTDDATARMDVVQTLARGLARAAQSANVISGSGSLDVLRYGRLLRCRRLVGVRGAGRAYDGEYVVRSVTTTVKAGEVKQRFTLGRNAQISRSGRAQP
ncbi:hypothetical protein [Micromonospora rifamycinica]|uniref:Phage protein D n=1 Tax=Micromonospora rifamycinica TaxID=291594 RepID=A0A109IN93_9ACTN|nr:hypothetical protein [Micromonospora rifamycinica]KWV33584.1 hypothetical protein AWV63_06470 [Micromonospora rifamycinica]SCG39460.1 hypothetical protein GA0070623_0550 [Micromonospora rifamycinica]